MWLKQSTAATVKLGPFVDSTDGVTAETALTIQKADVRLSKNGGNMAAASADQGTSDAGAAHDELGYYDVALDATDTATLGTLRVMVSESGALPVWQDFMVLPANVWDSLFGADKLEVDVTQVGGAAQDIATATALATVDGNVDLILEDTGTTLPATLSSMDAKLDTIDNFLDTEIAAILEDTGTTLDDLLDTEVAAIKAKTDSLTFTVAGQVDANIQSINDTPLTGDGANGTEWGPA